MSTLSQDTIGEVNYRNITIAEQAIDENVNDPKEREVMKRYVSNWNLNDIAYWVQISIEEVYDIINRREHCFVQSHYLGYSLSDLRKLCLS